MFLYFAKVVAGDYFSIDMDTVFLKSALATINCLYTMYLIIFLFKAYCLPSLFQDAHFNDPVFSRVVCFFKQTPALIIPFFKGIELIRKSSYSCPFDELTFFFYKRVTAAAHSFKLIVFLQNKNCIKKIS